MAKGRTPQIVAALVLIAAIVNAAILPQHGDCGFLDFRMNEFCQGAGAGRVAVVLFGLILSACILLIEWLSRRERAESDTNRV
jgi:hypothetical protein